MSQPNTTLKERLIAGLRCLQQSQLELPLVPLNGNKQPLGDGWPQRTFTATQLIAAIENGGVEVPIKGKITKMPLQGFGVLTGRPLTIDGITYYLMALDQDGESARGKILELSGGEPLPPTVAFTSNRPGRCQYLFLIPSAYRDGIRTKKIKTGIKGDDGKGEQVEFRWSNLQSVLPPSVHPTTGQYHWVEGCAIDAIEIALAPDWIVEQMLVEPKLGQGDQKTRGQGRFRPVIPSTRHPLEPANKRWTDIDYALSYLHALSSYRADDYDDWLTVGMALHSVGDSLLSEWEQWSQQSAKYKPGDCEKKWKSFSTNGGISLGTLAYLAKQDGWSSPFCQGFPASVDNHRNGQGTQSHNNGNSKGTQSDYNGYENGKGTQFNDNGNGRSNPERSQEVLVREYLKELLQQHLPPSQQTEAFNSLARATGWNVREIRILAEEVEADLDLVDSRNERHAQLLELETYKQLDLPLQPFLPPAYADPITRMAQWMEIPTAALLTGLLPTFASCLHPSTRITVKEAIGFVEAPIIYAGIVTESGQRKSPLMNALIDPLQQLQTEEEERYQRDQADYEAEYQHWQAAKEAMDEAEWKATEPVPPTPLQEFYLDKATIEAIDKIKSQQPHTSLLWKKDELSGLLNSYNAYKGGRGEDKESVLSGWNGRGVKKNLKGGERVSLKQDSMSIFGAIQDVTLQKKMGNFDDEQGEWGRFLWCLIPLKALRLPTSDTTFQLAFLKNLYQRARSLAPNNYRFAPDAQVLYDAYHWELELRRVAHPQRGMRAAIAKMEGYTARLALVLHLIWELEAGNTSPSTYIPKARVEAAIGLAEFFLAQVLLIHSEGAAALGEGGLTPRLSAILNKLRQFGEVTARKLQAAVSWLRKEKASKIRQDLIELAKLGYGKLVGQGNRLKLVLTADSAAGSAASSAASQSSSPALDLREIELRMHQGAVSADSHLTPASVPVAPTHFRDGNGHSPTPEARQERQQHQHISTLSSNPEASSLQGADGLSAKIAAVSAVVDENVAPVETTIASSSSPASQEDLRWLLQFLADLEFTPAPHLRFTSQQQIAALFDESEKRTESCLEQLLQICPNYFKRLSVALGVVSDALTQLQMEVTEPANPSAVSSGHTQISLAELQSLLLACRTLTAVEQLKETYTPERVKEVYEALPFEQQLIIDGLTAQTIPHPVYKYSGSTQTNSAGFELKPGMLVYLDEQSPQTEQSAWVWAIDGLSQGQCYPISITKSSLYEVAGSG